MELQSRLRTYVAGFFTSCPRGRRHSLKCAHINVHLLSYLSKQTHTHKPAHLLRAYTATHKCIGRKCMLAYVMGRLIGGFSNYELGKASGRRRQSDPSLLLWCISRAPTTADPIHMAINGALYINVIPALPPHKCMDYSYYQLRQSNVLLS